MESEVLGPVKLTVTQIQAGTQYNIVPDSFKFVVDVRTNEHYSNKVAFEIISGFIKSDVKARSFIRNSSGINTDHPFIKRVIKLGLKISGSPTTADQPVIPFTSVKICPWDSARSHTTNEYVNKAEIKRGIRTYIDPFQELEENSKRLVKIILFG